MNRSSFALAGLFAFCLTTSCFAQAPAEGSFTFTGTIDGLSKGQVYLAHQTGTPHKDSAKIEKGHFQFTGKITETEFCQLNIISPTGDQLYSTIFFLQPGSFTLTGKSADLRSAVVKGGLTQTDYLKYTESEKAIGSDFEKQKKTARTFVLAHPSSLVSAYVLLENFSYNPDENELESLYTGLNATVQNSFLGLQVGEVLRGAKLTSVGRQAPGFTQNDVDGKPVALSSFHGSYVLVDFWASWCGPCRRENPNIVKAFHQYHSKGFEILGVSLDDQKDKWLAAIKKDGLDWTQVSDLKGWDNQIAAQYGIKGIPMNFLLDKEGTIIAKGLTGEELEKKLADLLH
jgi:peroxiredoxin